MCCLMLSGCNNDEKLAKETYELLNETYEDVKNLNIDIYQVIYYLYDNEIVEFEDLTGRLNIDSEDFYNAYLEILSILSAE